MEFMTEKGSLYTVQRQGDLCCTQREKRHDYDAGIKEPSQVTLFVTELQFRMMQRLLMLASRRTWLVCKRTKKGIVLGVFMEDADKIVLGFGPTLAYTEPNLRLIPLELWGLTEFQGLPGTWTPRKHHFGNLVVRCN